MPSEFEVRLSECLPQELSSRNSSKYRDAEQFVASTFPSLDGVRFKYFSEPKQFWNRVGETGNPKNRADIFVFLMGARFRSEQSADEAAQMLLERRIARLLLLFRQEGHQWRLDRLVQRRGDEYHRILEKLVPTFEVTELFSAVESVPAVVVDHILWIEVANVRCIDHIHLDIDLLTVIIGDNGTGKSTIIQGIAMLADLAGGSASALQRFHGWPWIAHQRMEPLRLACRVGNRDHPQDYLEYHVEIDPDGRILEERLVESPDESPRALLTRRREKVWFGPRADHPIDVDPFSALVSQSHLTQSHASTGMERLRSALRRIEYHVGFDVLPEWVLRRTQPRSNLRSSDWLQRGTRLSLLGENLANILFSLRNDHPASFWEETMDLVRLGLGDHWETIDFDVDPAGGRVGIKVRFIGREPVPAAALSDGELAYLAFVAMCRNQEPRSLLAFDEPELHLHPALLPRVLALFESVSQRTPVVLATHSDRLLDLVADPSGVRILSRPRGLSTRILPLDPKALDEWLQHYRGLGELRTAGMLEMTTVSKP